MANLDSNFLKDSHQNRVSLANLKDYPKAYLQDNLGNLKDYPKAYLQDNMVNPQDNPDNNIQVNPDNILLASVNQDNQDNRASQVNLRDFLQDILKVN